LFGPKCCLRTHLPLLLFPIRLSSISRLFGKEEDQQDAVTELDDPENREVGEGQSNQSSSASTGKEAIDPGALNLHTPLITLFLIIVIALQELIDLSKSKALEEEAKAWERWLFHKVFHTDILQLTTLKSLWKKMAPPKPFDINEVLEGSVAASSHQQDAERVLEDQKVWGLKQCAQVFLRVYGAFFFFYCGGFQLNQLTTGCRAKELKELAASQEIGLQWDKDEELHLDFVTAASNLRSAQFNITTQSKFTVKSEAGNIIPAIATTNAIVAGLIVSEAVKIVAGRPEKCHQVRMLANPFRLVLTKCLLVTDFYYEATDPKTHLAYNSS